jgi:hypothetical protein
MEEVTASSASSASSAALVVSAATYAEYLDAQVTEQDIAYLGDEAMARSLMELGHRGGGGSGLLKRADFEARTAAAASAAAAAARGGEAAPRPLASAGAALAGRPFLQALAAREAALRARALASVAFLRARNARGQEVSGYVDLAHRLDTDDAEAYFSGAATLLPRPSDLSFYNADAGAASGVSSPFWAVLVSDDGVLSLKNKRDRKALHLDPAAPPGDNTTRTAVAHDRDYLQAIIFDHARRN